MSLLLEHDHRPCHKKIFFNVSLFVLFQSAHMAKPLPTYVAPIRFFIRMDAHMYVERCQRQCLFTDFADYSCFVIMFRFGVTIKVCFLTECLRAGMAPARPLVAMWVTVVL